MRKNEKDPRTVALRYDPPVPFFHYHETLVRAAWMEYKSSGRFPDSYGDLLDIDIRLRSDILLYHRCVEYSEAWELVNGSG